MLLLRCVVTGGVNCLQFAKFDQLMRSDPAHLLDLIGKVQRWLVCKTWRKVIYGTISVLKRKRRSGAVGC